MPLMWVDDQSLSLADRCGSYELWLVEHEKWREERHVWAYEHGWPTGFEEMWAEEPDVPACPFDPSII